MESTNNNISEIKSIDTSPRYQAYSQSMIAPGTSRGGFCNINKMADNSKIFNAPQTHTYK